LPPPSATEVLLTLSSNRGGTGLRGFGDCERVLGAALETLHVHDAGIFGGDGGGGAGGGGDE